MGANEGERVRGQRDRAPSPKPAAGSWRVEVAWTDKKTALPSRMGQLTISPTDLILTEKRLIRTEPRLRPLTLGLCWAAAVALGLFIGGLSAAVTATFYVMAIGFIGQRRVADQRAVADVADSSRLVAEGWNRAFGRDVLTLAFRDGTHWRMSLTGRNERSVTRIADALARAGIATRVAKP